MKRNNKNGFTLVELLAVIVILAIILVIAVPKVMSVIEDSKKATLESTAKMIASSAEKAKVQNTVLGNDKEITCDSVAKINNLDYASCSITFDNNTAKVTIEGSGKFEGLWVCEGTKTSVVAQENSCYELIEHIEIEQPLFLAGQSLTPDKFNVKAKLNNGKHRILHNGTEAPVVDENIDPIIITSPNWPNNYPNNMTEEENYWEYTFEGAEEIHIEFDESSNLQLACGFCDSISIYNKDGERKKWLGESINGTYIVKGDYVKIAMVSDNSGTTKGFSASIKPAYSVPAEYTVSPNVVPNIEGNFDMTITINETGMSKKMTVGAVHNIEDYVVSLEPFEIVLENKIKQTNATYNGTTYDAGIRYIGSMADVKNKVYYNCDDTDTNGVSYGENNYDYASSCEVWRIIGVFNTKSSTSSDAVPRVKLINIASTFKVSYDSSSNDVNSGFGINQWGEIKDTNGNVIYEGSDLMRLLNGYYIGVEGATCTYCNGNGQEECSQTCDTSDNTLASQNMKPLSNNAKSMIENAVWDTYGVKSPSSSAIGTSSSILYLEEKGISQQYKGNSLCDNANTNYCDDTITRTTSWIGLVGLASVSDTSYSSTGYGGWVSGDPAMPSWSITPVANGDNSKVWSSYATFASNYNASNVNFVKPSVYLKPGVKVISGNGDDKPYILGM